MAKEIIAHHLTDWSKVDEKAGFWGRIDLLRPEINFGIHRYNDNLWTSGQVGVGRLYDRNGVPIQDNGKEHAQRLCDAVMGKIRSRYFTGRKSRGNLFLRL